MVTFSCSIGSYFMAFMQPQELKKEKVDKRSQKVLIKKIKILLSDGEQRENIHAFT